MYLVTGAAGFIGYRTCHQLLKQGHDVVGIDNLNDYYDIQLKEWRIAELSGFKNFKFLSSDIENRKSLSNLFQDYSFQKVINLAGRAGVRASLDQPHAYFETNATGTLNLLDLCRENGIDHFVTASTSSVFSGVEAPYHEGQMVDTPISPYAASKRAAELISYTYSHQYDINTAALRFFTVYGPFGRPDMSILRFIRWINEGQAIQLNGTGEQSRDFTYVDDIVDGVIRSSSMIKGHEVINLGGGNNPISMNQIISMISNKLGKEAIINKLPSHNADVDITWADISKAKNLLDWQPLTSIDEGLNKTIDWYLANRDRILKISF